MKKWLSSVMFVFVAATGCAVSEEPVSEPSDVAEPSLLAVDGEVGEALSAPCKPTCRHRCNCAYQLCTQEGDSEEYCQAERHACVALCP